MTDTDNPSTPKEFLSVANAEYPSCSCVRRMSNAGSSRIVTISSYATRVSWSPGGP